MSESRFLPWGGSKATKLSSHARYKERTIPGVLVDDLLYDAAMVHRLPSRSRDRPGDALRRLAMTLLGSGAGIFLLFAGLAWAEGDMHMATGQPGNSGLLGLGTAILLVTVVFAAPLGVIGTLQRRLAHPPLHGVLLDLEDIRDDKLRGRIRRAAAYAAEIAEHAPVGGIDPADAHASTMAALTSIVALAVEHDALTDDLRHVGDGMTKDQTRRVQAALKVAEGQIASRMHDLRETAKAAVECAQAADPRRLQIGDRVDNLLAITEGDRTVAEITHPEGTSDLRREVELRLAILKDQPL